LYVGTFLSAALVVTPSACPQCDLQDLDGAAPDGFDSPPSALVLDGRFAAVGLSGSMLVPGHVLVYRRAGGQFELMANLHTPNPEVTGDDLFGTELAISGDVLAIGAQGLQSGCGIGAVHVYRYNGQTWMPEQTILPPTCDAGNFGSSLALQGDVLLVGAPTTAQPGPEAGAANVYRYNASRWSLEATLIVPEGEAFSGFGRSVALSGQTAMIGSPGDDEAGSADGATFVFAEQDRQWTFQQKLLPTDATQINEGFGAHIALHGDVAAIGAPDCCSPPSGVGNVYVLRFDGRMWVHEQQIVHPSGVGFFGDPALAAGGQTLLVSSDYSPVFLYRYEEGAWISAGEITFDGAQFVIVAPAGDVALLGIRYANGSGAVQLIGGLGPLDCNGNSVGDACDIAAGVSADADDDGVPDECQTAPDLTGDSAVDAADLGAMLAAWGECPAGDACLADLNNDGVVGPADLAALLGAWGPYPALTCPGAGDCCTAHGQPGCEQATCCGSVCENDPYCCLTAWDALCALSAISACDCPSPAACGQSSEDCCFPHDSPGCGDSACCSAVCDVDSFCCEQAWDFICYTEAFQFCDCPGTPKCDECGEFSCGDCCDATFQPGCNDAACCQLVCNDIDPFCCEVAWDGICANIAEDVCGICGP
jgi:hypothetical protein